MSSDRAPELGPPPELPAREVDGGQAAAPVDHDRQPRRRRTGCSRGRRRSGSGRAEHLLPRQVDDQHGRGRCRHRRRRCRPRRWPPPTAAPPTERRRRSACAPVARSRDVSTQVRSTATTSATTPAAAIDRERTARRERDRPAGRVLREVDRPAWCVPATRSIATMRPVVLAHTATSAVDRDRRDLAGPGVDRPALAAGAAVERDARPPGRRSPARHEVAVDDRPVEAGALELPSPIACGPARSTARTPRRSRVTTAPSASTATAPRCRREVHRPLRRRARSARAVGHAVDERVAAEHPASSASAMRAIVSDARSSWHHEPAREREAARQRLGERDRGRDERRAHDISRATGTARAVLRAPSASP